MKNINCVFLGTFILEIRTSKKLRQSADHAKIFLRHFIGHRDN